MDTSKNSTKEKDIYLHLNRSDYLDIIKYLHTRIKSTRVNDSVVILLFLQMEFHRYGKPEFYCSLQEFVENTCIQERTSQDLLSILENANIIKRGVRYEKNKTDGIKRKKIWVTIVDQEIIKLFHLEKICNKPSEIEQQAIKKEQQKDFYKDLKKATETGNYFKVYEAFDNVHEVIKNVAYLYNEKRYTITHAYSEWDSELFAKLKVALHKYTEYKNIFDYSNVLLTFNSLGIDWGNWNVTDFTEELKNNLKQHKRDIPPFMSFNDLYKKVKGKELPQAENEIAC